MAPEGWTRYKVSDLLADDAPGYWGSTPSGTGDVAVLRSTNLTDDHRLNISNVALRSFPENKILEKKLEPGDLLLERSGGGPNRPVGRIAYFNHESCFCYSNFMQRLRPDQRRVRPEFLAYLLSHLHLSGVTLLMQQATTGIRNLNYREYPRPRPTRSTAPRTAQDCRHSLLGGRCPRKGASGHRPIAGRQARPDAGTPRAELAGAAYASR